MAGVGLLLAGLAGRLDRGAQALPVLAWAPALPQPLAAWTRMRWASLLPETLCGALPRLVQYLVALYWSVQTLTTVGYGDVVPVNNSERAYVIIALTLGAGYFTCAARRHGRDAEVMGLLQAG